MSNEADIFDQYHPEITEQEANRAGQDGRIIQSFNAHPISNTDGTIPALAIKLKLTNGATETVLIGHYAALIIRMMISELEARSLDRVGNTRTNANHPRMQLRWTWEKYLELSPRYCCCGAMTPRQHLISCPRQRV